MTMMKDRINYPDLAFWGIGIFLSFLILIGIEYSNGQLTTADFILAAIIFFCVFCLTGLRLEFWYRPKNIVLMDDGVILNFFIRRSKKHLWSEIDKINVITDPSFKRTRSYVDSTLDQRPVNGKKPKGYVLHYTLALAIREHYKDAMGHYPVNSKEEQIQRKV